MKLHLSILCLVLLLSGKICSQGMTDSLIVELKETIKNKATYIKIKEDNINNLKKISSVGILLPEQEYDINDKIIQQYKKYMSDSAVYYSHKNIEIAKSMKNQHLVNASSIQLSWLYSIQGLYVEAKDILDSIDRKNLNEKLLPDYYETFSSYYSHYAQSNNYHHYYAQSELYRDSLLMVLDTTTIRYKRTYATKVFYDGQKEEAKDILLDLLNEVSDDNPERAIIAYLLSLKYEDEDNFDLQKRYLLMSAITDLKNSIRDNASLFALALMYYNSENIDQAYNFIQLAINDAIESNTLYRAIEIATSYPIINAAYQEKEKKQKEKLQISLISISILSLAVLIISAYLYKQMKRLSSIRKELYDTNQKLSALNAELYNANNSLYEANHIKEEYIGHFFDLCSSYIDKLENYRKSLNRMLMNDEMKKLAKTIKSTNTIESEIEELYENFDSIFLNLYPTFIEEFNKLLLPEERIYPKQGELLNTELRIFALIRLGITDSVKIANFLRYSLRTVYNYRTKVRNKSAVPRDEFEGKVKEIVTFKTY